MEQFHAVWIALAEAESDSEETGLALGEKAFVNVLVSACSENDAAATIRSALEGLCFRMVSLEGVELWSVRFRSRVPEEELSALAKLVEETGEPQFDTFHTWENQG
jgi:hypothetical protein